jgi:acyl-CoA thioesterase
MRLLHDRLEFDSVEPHSPELSASSGATYVRETDQTFWGHEAQFGGYVEALALAAMRAELRRNDPAAPEMRPVTVGIQFFRPFVDGKMRIEVTLERRGRTMANLHARLHSGGKLAGQAVAAFGTRREHAEFQLASPPRELVDEPLGAEEPDTPSIHGVPTHAHFQFFPRIGGFTPGSGEGALVGGWVRPHFDTPLDESLLVMIQDMWLPAAYHRWREPTVAVSIDITTQFRAALPYAGPASDGIFVTLHTTGSLGGFVDEDCELWSAAGDLLAQGRQTRFVH